jgi:hypothetical protein
MAEKANGDSLTDHSARHVESPCTTSTMALVVCATLLVGWIFDFGERECNNETSAFTWKLGLTLDRSVRGAAGVYVLMPNVRIKRHPSKHVDSDP